VKFLMLSDHTSQQINRAEQSREAEYQAQVAKYKEALARIQIRRENANQILRSAWQERRIARILARGWEYLSSRFTLVPTLPIKARADRQEIVWAAGKEGEQIVLQELTRQLSDAWTVMAGYRNRMGEIDLVAVGPEGIAAIEVKYLNGLMYCEGDSWYRDRYDKYGNLVEQRRMIADRRGRSPSRQLNDTAGALQDFLAHRRVPVRVLRVVVLSHPNSRLGTFNDQTVDWVSTVESFNLTEFCRDRCVANSPAQVEKLVDFIRKDHTFSDRLRPGKKLT
jgi:hypothetical protein